MTTLDSVEAWWISVRALTEKNGVTSSFQRSSTNRLNPSCSLNLRLDEVEADLLVWESGEAELSTRARDGSIEKVHFENVRKETELLTVLRRLEAFVS